MAGHKAAGTTLEFEKNGSEQENIVIGNLTSIGEIGVDSDEIEETTHDSLEGYKEFAQGLKDGGEIPVSGYFYEGKNQEKLIQLFDTGEKRNAIVTFPSGAKMTVLCFVKSYKIGPFDLEGFIGFSASLRVTGKPKFAESAGA